MFARSRLRSAAIAPLKLKTPGGQEGAEEPGDVDVAEGDLNQGLVEGVPVVGAITQLPGEVGGVLLELVDGPGLQPAAGVELGKRLVEAASRQRLAGGERVVEPGGEGPVVQGDERGDPSLGRRREDVPVVMDRSLVGEAVEALEVALVDLGADVDSLGGAGKDPRPLDGEAEGVVVEVLGDEVEVAAKAQPVAGTVLGQVSADGAVGDVPRIVGPDVPVARRVDVVAPAGLGLKARDRGSPEEASGNSSAAPALGAARRPSRTAADDTVASAFIWK